MPGKLGHLRVALRARVVRDGITYAYMAVTILCAPNIARPQSAELDHAFSLVQQGKVQEAEQRLLHYLQTRPGSPRANNLLGTIYLRQGRFEQAEVLFQKAVAEAPKFLEPRVNLGEAYLAAGKLDLALAAYQAAAKIAPADPRVNLGLAQLYLGEGEFAKSLEAAGNTPTAKRTDELLPTLAADYFGLHETEKADVEIRSMLEVAEKKPDLVPELAEFFLAHRDFNSSQQLLALARNKQPVTDRLQVDLALTQAGLGHLDEAQKTLEDILARNPGSVGALAAAGQVASQQLNWDAAIEAFTRAASLAPDRPDILFGLASAQLYGNHNDDALKNAEKLHSLYPSELRSTYVLALALFGVNKWEEAKHCAQQVLAVHPDDREMHLILADVALNDERDWQSAQKHADICLKQNPNDPGALYYLGMAQKMEGKVGAAIQSFSKSVAANPQNANAQGALGALCLQSGDLGHAVPALEQAVLLMPDEPQNHYQLALAYSRSGARDKAKIQLDLYQQMKTKEAKEAKERKGPSTTEIPHMGIAERP
ncbi:MAG: tetratricopeptide repeat protein [Candidatus Acidiferrales bacterium]